MLLRMILANPDLYSTLRAKQNPQQFPRLLCIFSYYVTKCCRNHEQKMKSRYKSLCSKHTLTVELTDKNFEELKTEVMCSLHMRWVKNGKKSNKRFDFMRPQSFIFFKHNVFQGNHNNGTKGAVCGGDILKSVLLSMDKKGYMHNFTQSRNICTIKKHLLLTKIFFNQLEKRVGHGFIKFGFEYHSQIIIFFLYSNSSTNQFW